MSHSITSTIFYKPRQPRGPPSVRVEDTGTFSGIFQNYQSLPFGLSIIIYNYSHFSDIQNTLNSLPRPSQSCMPFGIRLRAHLNQNQVRLRFSGEAPWKQILEYCFYWSEECISNNSETWGTFSGYGRIWYPWKDPPAAAAAAAAAKSRQSCLTLRPYRQQPTRLPCPWDSPGKNTGVGCHFLLQCMKVKSESEVAQLCLTLSDPVDCSLPGSSIHGIFQARVLEWVPLPFRMSKYYVRATNAKI